MSIQEINNSFLNTPFNGVAVPSVSIHNFNENVNFTQDETNNLIYNLTIDIKTLSFIYDDDGDNNNILKHIKIKNSSIIETAQEINNIIENRIQNIKTYATIENYLNDIQFYINQDLTINLNVILKPLVLQEEEQPELINYSCFCCSNDYEKAEIIKYCNNAHSDRVCLSCYKLLKNKGLKCPICRASLYKYIKNSNADLIRIYGEFKNRILNIKNTIFSGLIDFNRAQEKKINDAYFFYNDDTILTYPFKIGELNYNFNLNKINNNPYNDLTEEINKTYIEDYSEYQNIGFLILKCINKKLFLYFPSDEQDEEDAENQEEDINLITGAMLKIYNELEADLDNEKVIITNDRLNYRFNVINPQYLFYYYMSFIKHKPQTTINKLFLLVKADYLNNKGQYSNIHIWKFKYNNLVHTININSDDSINIYVCKKIKQGKKFIFDMEHIKEYNLTIKNYNDLEDDYKETLSEQFYYHSNLYHYLDNQYPLTFDLHNILIDNIRENEDGNIIGQMWINLIEPHINISGAFNFYLDNDTNNIIELIEIDGTNYYLEGVEDINNYISMEGGFLECD